MACAICEIRRPRRFCPGVLGDICAPCCGAEREITVDCPLDCEYLAEARKHDRPPSLEGLELPHADIEITEKLIAENEQLLSYLSAALLRAALDTPGAVDYDVREALDAVARTYRTLQTGIYYETRPTNPLAAALYSAVQEAIREFREEERRSLGITRTRDSDVLGLVVFLARIEMDRNNGRRRGRAFLHSMLQFHTASSAAAPEAAARSSIILP
jgi:hypothetical protein